MRLARLPGVFLIVGCSREPAPAPPATPVANTAPADAASVVPPGAIGACIDNAKAAGVDDDHQPTPLAACPNPLEMVRGNGLSGAPYPPVTPAAMPAWDLDATRAYACAYACAPAGATASLLGWSIYEDPRPLRNENAAYVVANAKANKWTVVVMWRHAFNLWWNVGGGVHDRRIPIVDFDHAPTAVELDKVLDDNDWSTGSGGGGASAKLLAGNMIDEVWPGTTTHHFPAGFER